MNHEMDNIDFNIRLAFKKLKKKIKIEMDNIDFNFDF